MHIDALLHDVGAKAALLSLFAPAVRPPERFRLFWAKDWPELQGRAEAGITDVAILDPYHKGISVFNTGKHRFSL
jgi:hypothetical protein